MTASGTDGRKAREELISIGVAEGCLRGMLHHPTGRDRTPAVLVCRGVTLPGAEPSSLLDDTIDQLVESGVRVMTYAGREQPDVGGDVEPDVTGADLVDDASAALRWLLLREDVDLRRVGVLGCAVGAMVAAYLAGRSDQLAALGLVAPIVPQLAIRQFERQARAEAEEAEDAAPEPSRLPAHLLRSLPDDDPIAAAARYDRPTLLLHGAADRIAPVPASVRYAERIADAGHAVDVLLLARADHGFSEPAARQVAVRRLVRLFGAMLPRPTAVAS